MWSEQAALLFAILTSACIYDVVTNATSKKDLLIRAFGAVAVILCAAAIYSLLRMKM